MLHDLCFLSCVTIEKVQSWSPNKVKCVALCTSSNALSSIISTKSIWFLEFLTLRFDKLQKLTEWMPKNTRWSLIYHSLWFPLFFCVGTEDHWIWFWQSLASYKNWGTVYVNKVWPLFTISNRGTLYAISEVEVQTSKNSNSQSNSSGFLFRGCDSGNRGLTSVSVNRGLILATLGSLTYPTDHYIILLIG